jgi:signal transduction histidine kinase/ActR/RegA family two-component response regulator
MTTAPQPRRIEKPKSVLKRALLGSFTLVGTAVVCMTVLLVANERNAFQQQLELRARTLTTFVAKQSALAMLVGDREDLDRIVKGGLGNDDVLSVTIQDSAGEFMVTKARQGVQESTPNSTRFIEVTEDVIAERENRMFEWEPARSTAQRLGSVRVRFSMDKQETLFANSAKGVIAIALVTLALILAAEYLQLRRLLAPLGALMKVTKEVAAGNLDRSVPVWRLDEVGQLATAFNQMVGELSQSRQELIDAAQKSEAANRMKSEFLANVSHELRTPLNGIIGNAELALSTALDAEQQEYVATVRSSGKSLLTIISDILDFSKIESGKGLRELVEFDLRALLTDCLGLFAWEVQRKGLNLSLTINPAVPTLLYGDETHLRQIVLNLVGNAVKFTGAGKVSVDVELQSAGEAECLLQFAIADTGIGIPAKKLDSIFEPFIQADGSLTRRYGGTGLGLTISKRLVELLGGRISVESRPDVGSTFKFTARFLKRATETLPAQPVMEHDNGDLRRLHVLLAEDNPVNSRLAVRLMEKLGHSVVAVANGRAAVEALDRERFDVVLMDVQMPEMDGYRATAALREKEKGTGAHLPVVALTAHAMAGDREKCLEAGMDGYLSKPIDLKELSDTLNSFAAPKIGQAPRGA